MKSYQFWNSGFQARSFHSSICLFGVFFLWDRRENQLREVYPIIHHGFLQIPGGWLALGFLNHQQEDWGAGSLTHLSMPLDCWTTKDENQKKTTPPRTWIFQEVDGIHG